MSGPIILPFPTDTSGRLEVRPASAVAGATMYYSGPTFSTAKIDSVFWKQINQSNPATQTDRNWATITLYDATGAVTTTETDAKYTQLDILIAKDLELTGGSLALPNNFPDPNLTGIDWRVWVTVAPEIPAEYGGQVNLVEGLKLSGFYEGEDIIIDGRSPKFLQYVDASGVAGLGWWANKIRFLFQHPTGLNPSVTPAHKADFQLILDSYIKWS